MNKRFILLFFPLLMLQQLSAQENTYQTWLDYDHHYKRNGNWRFFSDYGVRWQSMADLDNWYRVHARPSLGFKPSTLMDYMGGIGIFFTDNKTAADQFEIRPWQGLNIAWPNIRRARFYNYFRLEERFSFRINQSQNFVLKFRYKLGVRIPINNTIISTGTFYIPASIELFLDLSLNNTEQNNDRTRIELGLGYRWTAKTNVQVLYTLQKIFNNQNEGFDFTEGFAQNDHILRITVTQKFGFDK